MFFTRRQFLKKLGFIGSIITICKNFSFASSIDNYLESNVSLLENQSFYGINQSGILTPQQSNIMLISFDVLAENKKDLKRLFILLTNRIDFLTKKRKIEDTNIKMPPKDSGILGNIIYPNNLTITVSVGYSLFDKNFNIKQFIPTKLKEMEHFPNDALDDKLCHGDLLLQICANSNDTVIHALRDIVKYTPDLLSIKWLKEGFISNHAAFSKGKITPTNLLGFKDGTANPDSKNYKIMNRFIWVNSLNKEPIWCYGGSYQVIRIIKFRIEFWDRIPLQEQQRIFGREKYSGAPLGMFNEHDKPLYDNKTDNKLIPSDSHIRLANPNNDNNHTILRRGYNYSQGITSSGQLNMGLLFICYQNDLEKGFLSIQNSLNKEPLEEYIKPIGGGYFFVLPGVIKKKNYLAQSLIESC